MNKSPKKERGVSLVLTAILMFTLIGMAAFAVDIGYYFVAKNRLQNAVDAAALAGVDTLYTPPSGNTFSPSTFPSTSNINFVTTAVTNSLSLNGYPSVTPNIIVNWWDQAGAWNISPFVIPEGHYHYPAVQVSIISYPASVFFAKIFGYTSLNVNVTAMAVTEIPGSIATKVPFVISYCTVDKGWDVATGKPKTGGVADFIIGAVNSGGSLYDCIANNIIGTMTGSNKLTVTGGDYKRLTVNTAIADKNSILPNNTKITGVGSPTGTGICTNLPCDFYLNKSATINDPTNTITADSGPLGNWTPLIYSTSNIGASTITSYIPPVISSVSVPPVSIGNEIRVQTGAVDSLYQAMSDCWNAGAGPCAKVAIPVVNGLQCAGGATSCPATTTSDPNYPLTGVNLAPVGIPLNDNFPVLGFACVKITLVQHGSTKDIEATLDTGCQISGTGGGQVYYGVLLPPVLAN
jgi:hypothetical protein